MYHVGITWVIVDKCGYKCGYMWINVCISVYIVGMWINAGIHADNRERICGYFMCIMWVLRG